MAEATIEGSHREKKERGKIKLKYKLMCWGQVKREEQDWELILSMDGLQKELILYWASLFCEPLRKKSYKVTNEFLGERY